jgi:hypothetical protein
MSYETKSYSGQFPQHPKLWHYKVARICWILSFQISPLNTFVLHLNELIIRERQLQIYFLKQKWKDSFVLLSSLYRFLAYQNISMFSFSSIPKSQKSSPSFFSSWFWSKYYLNFSRE